MKDKTLNTITREKIIKIIRGWLSKLNFKIPYPNGNYTLVESDFKELADEILALGWYPKEFVQWLCEKGTIQQEEQPNIWLNTLNELYNYWLKEVKQ